MAQGEEARNLLFSVSGGPHTQARPGGAGPRVVPHHPASQVPVTWGSCHREDFSTPLFHHEWAKDSMFCPGLPLQTREVPQLWGTALPRPPSDIPPGTRVPLKPLQSEQPLNCCVRWHAMAWLPAQCPLHGQGFAASPHPSGLCLHLHPVGRGHREGDVGRQTSVPLSQPQTLPSLLLSG